MERKYPAKILVLGEYTVLNGSDFLSLPCEEKYMLWSQSNQVNKKLISFLAYLEDQKVSFLDLRRIFLDLKNGDTLISNIPQGYGLGSSGALCAAFYDRYAIRSEKELKPLLDQFVIMESYFHGQSSGTDPIVSYLSKPIYRLDGSLEADKNLKAPQDIHLFLLDSQIHRETEKLVDIYNKSVKSKTNKLTKPTNELLKGIIKNNSCEIKASFREISSLQLEIFGMLIPPHIDQLWRKGLESEQFYLKLCGAGGGGYFLGLDMTNGSLEGFKKETIKWNGL